MRGCTEYTNNDKEITPTNSKLFQYYASNFIRKMKRKKAINFPNINTNESNHVQQHFLLSKGKGSSSTIGKGRQTFVLLN